MIEQHQLDYQTKGRAWLDITDDVKHIVRGSQCQNGLCHLFVMHTSASILLCENYDPQVRQDLERFFQDLVPDGDPRFGHSAEGPDDMPAHVRTVLTQSDLSIPIKEYSLALGTWQGIYLWEHRHHSFSRHITLTLLS